MTKGQMKEILDKVDSLEKILMRELNEQEIEYLKDHSVNDFIYDVLEFDKEDLLALLKVQKIISDWCTKPEEDWNPNDLNLFDDLDLISESDIKLFKESPHKVNERVSNLLATIISEFTDGIRPSMMTRVITAENLDSSDHCDFSKFDEVPENECGNEISEEDTISVIDAVPENAKKWTKDLSIQEITKAIDKASEIVVTDLSEEKFKKCEPVLFANLLPFKWGGGTKMLDLEDLKEHPELEDELISEVVDQIKDAAIQHYVELIQKEGEWEFCDEEIQSEVLDYLYKHDYKVKSINNKISLV